MRLSARTRSSVKEALDLGGGDIGAALQYEMRCVEPDELHVWSRRRKLAHETQRGEESILARGFAEAFPDELTDAHGGAPLFSERGSSGCDVTHVTLGMLVDASGGWRLRRLDASLGRWPLPSHAGSNRHSG